MRALIATTDPARSTRGFSDDDIKDYETSELLTAMIEWTEAGQPILPS